MAIREGTRIDGALDLVIEPFGLDVLRSIGGNRRTVGLIHSV